jgi:Lsr2
MEVEVAQRVTITLEDDLGGGPADETVRFAFGGTEYEIDLSAKNATAFRQKLAPSSSTPARPGAASRAAPPRAGRAAVISGRGPTPRHRGQWARAHPRQRGGAIPSRYQTALTPVLMGLGEGSDAHARARPDAPQG